MKRLFYLLALCALLLPALAWAWSVPDEDITYSVRYKWGFIDANAGVAHLTTRNIPDSNMFQATLSGKSVNLMGHYYAATDTIVGTFMADTVRSVSSQRLTKADGEFAIETITYPPAGNPDGEKIVKKLPGGKVLRERISHYGGGVTVDLLGVFYYMRQIDYPAMKPGDHAKVKLLAGNNRGTIDVVYKGNSTADSCGTTLPVYTIGLTYTPEGESATVTSLTAAISQGVQRTPLTVSAGLKFGHIQATLVSDSVIPAIHEGN